MSLFGNQQRNVVRKFRTATHGSVLCPTQEWTQVPLTGVILGYLINNPNTINVRLRYASEQPSIEDTAGITIRAYNGLAQEGVIPDLNYIQVWVYNPSVDTPVTLETLSF
jgi:hypothetical protein